MFSGAANTKKSATHSKANSLTKDSKATANIRPPCCSVLAICLVPKIMAKMAKIPVRNNTPLVVEAMLPAVGSKITAALSAIARNCRAK